MNKISFFLLNGFVLLGLFLLNTELACAEEEASPLSNIQDVFDLIKQDEIHELVDLSTKGLSLTSPLKWKEKVLPSKYHNLEMRTGAVLDSVRSPEMVDFLVEQGVKPKGRSLSMPLSDLGAVMTAVDRDLKSKTYTKLSDDEVRELIGAFKFMQAIDRLKELGARVSSQDWKEHLDNRKEFLYPYFSKLVRKTLEALEGTTASLTPELMDLIVQFTYGLPPGGLPLE